MIETTKMELDQIGVWLEIQMIHERRFRALAKIEKDTILNLFKRQYQ